MSGGLILSGGLVLGGPVPYHHRLRRTPVRVLDAVTGAGVCSHLTV